MAAAGCLGGQSGDSGGSSRTVVDGAGRSVELPASVERVVAIGPGALRQVAYFGATDRVVGVEDGERGWIRRVPYNQANPELRDRPVVGAAGPNAGGNAEAILVREPDVIFFYGDPSRAESLSQQTETPVVVLNIVDLVTAGARETLYDTWALVGEVLDRPERAAELEATVEDAVADLAERTADVPTDSRPEAYAGAINYKGAHGVATTRSPFPPFAFTNVANVAATVESDAVSVQVSEENLVTWDPQTMFVSAANLARAREDLQTSESLGDLAAVRNGRTYVLLPHASYHHNYGSMLANAYFVGKTVYPDRFADVSLRATTNDLFEALLGTPLYDDLTGTYDAFGRLEV
jgi:iron complex transport system substrate-binding protein